MDVARIQVTLRPADVAWLALGVGVIAYELCARDGDLMSEAVDRYLAAHPWLTRAVIAATAAHLANALPSRCDPYYLATALRTHVASRISPCEYGECRTIDQAPIERGR